MKKKTKKKQNILKQALEETLKNIKNKPYLFVLAFFFDVFLIGTFMLIIYSFLPKILINIQKINQAMSSLNINLTNITQEKIMELSNKMLALNQQLQVYYHKILANIFFIFILSFLAFIILGFFSYYFIYLMQREKQKFLKFLAKFILASLSYLIIFIIIFFIISGIITKSFSIYIFQFLILVTIYFAFTTFSSLNKNAAKITFKANIKKIHIFLPLYIIFILFSRLLYFIAGLIPGILTKLIVGLLFLALILLICEFYKALLIALTKNIK